MAKSLHRVLVFQALLAVLVTAMACNKLKKNNDVGQGPNPGGGPPGMPGGQWPGGPGGKRGPIADIMAKLTKGPESLTSIIGNELNQTPPPWEKIRPQAKEYAQLAASMSKYDPPRGEKESWKKQTSSYAQSATELETAAEAKNLDAAKAAHGAITKSCQACHQAHRGGLGMMGGPPGGFRGPRGPGGPPGQPQ
jgi:hypothetical protein